MALTTVYQRFRRDMGLAEDDTASLSDPAIDALLEEAGETYTGTATISAYARVLYLRGKLSSASSEVDYTQNESQEKASQRFDHWRDLLAFWEGRLVVAGPGVGAASVFTLAHGYRGR